LKAKSLNVQLNKDCYLGDAEMNVVTSTQILAKKLITNELKTSVIVSNNKQNALYINSFLKVTGQIKYESGNEGKSKGSSFIQLSHENLYINHVRQWKLLNEYDLRDVNSDFNAFLSSHLISAEMEKNKNANSKQLEISKNFNITTKSFDHVLIEANFKFVNHIWNNNTAYIKINGDLFWLDHHSWEENSTGSSESQCDEEKWNNPIRIVVPNKENKLKNLEIKFGVKLNEKFNFEGLKLNQCPSILKILNSMGSIEFENLHISVK
jgi:hypothetical protein